jgi:predicted metal-dependent hydrolase
MFLEYILLHELAHRFRVDIHQDLANVHDVELD